MEHGNKGWSRLAYWPRDHVACLFVAVGVCDRIFEIEVGPA